MRNKKQIDKDSELILLEVLEISRQKRIIYIDLITVSFLITMIINSYIQKNHLVIFFAAVIYLVLALFYKCYCFIFDLLTIKLKQNERLKD
ncbi:hypothetical protein [Litchfieldia alkalitelluris]|uniref:hypothetical protein n=1 Tax=Litchfieldia alkalitelluris TaxID=304268 RepID=UPI00099877E2|nr:hypothetical protein [Litchfieldia alkalitelluris]